MIEMAKKFGDNPHLEFLMVSVDDTREKWTNFLNDNIESSVTNVFIKNGMKMNFGRQFNINAIPNYVLIDKRGLIVNAYIKEPSKEVEEMIFKELSK